MEKVNKPIIERGPNQRWVADLIDLRKMAAFNNNFKYVLNIVDSFSKRLWSIPLKSKKADKIAEEFETVFKVEKPHVLQSDNGKEFRSNTLAAICREYGIKQVFATAYKPNSSGQVERTNRTLKQMILHLPRPLGNSKPFYLRNTLFGERVLNYL